MLIQVFSCGFYSTVFLQVVQTCKVMYILWASATSTRSSSIYGKWISRSWLKQTFFLLKNSSNIHSGWSLHIIFELKYERKITFLKYLCTYYLGEKKTHPILKFLLEMLNYWGLFQFGWWESFPYHNIKTARIFNCFSQGNTLYYDLPTRIQARCIKKANA